MTQIFWAGLARPAARVPQVTQIFWAGLAVNSCLLVTSPVTVKKKPGCVACNQPFSVQSLPGRLLRINKLVCVVCLLSDHLPSTLGPSAMIYSIFHVSCRRRRRGGDGATLASAITLNSISVMALGPNLIFGRPPVILPVKRHPRHHIHGR